MIKEGCQPRIEKIQDFFEDHRDERGEETMFGISSPSRWFRFF
jgi:hypothetical protein